MGLPSCAPGSAGERRFDYVKLTALQKDEKQPIQVRKAAYMARNVHSSLMEAMEHYREIAGCKDMPENIPGRQQGRSKLGRPSQELDRVSTDQLQRQGRRNRPRRIAGYSLPESRRHRLSDQQIEI